MPDIEFLTGDAADGGDEVLDTGPQRPVARWVLLAGFVVVAALIVTVVVRQGRGGAPTAGPSTPPGPSRTSQPSTQVPPTLAVAGAYALVGDERDRRLYALSGAQLFAVGANGRPIGHGVPVQVGDASNAEVELVLDAPNNIVWAVPQNATGHDGNRAGFAEPFEARSLQSLERIPLPGLVEGAAVLGGSLYVSTGAGLWRATAGAPFDHVAGAAAAANAMLVADPARNRLICVEFGAHAVTARSYRTVSGMSAPRPLPAHTISLVVLGRTIWLAGSRHGHALLTSLDPRTLRARRDVLPGTPDVELQGTGRSSLYVSVGSRLDCLAGSDGRLLQDLGRSDGAFASVGGRGFVGTPTAVHRVPMGRCPG